MNEPLKMLETRVNRTYRGGYLMDKFLGKAEPKDTFLPEDWISSFVQAVNKNYVEGEGITLVEHDGETKLITEVIDKDDFGEGRDEPKLLTKLLDSMERLGVQVHPNAEFAMENFGVGVGKTEAWHILDSREVNGEKPVIYIGFKEYVTRDVWKELFEKQDIQGMLDALHKFEVKQGDTILVRSGYPHAIGAGCFLLEIQEPCDFTMRTEKTTLAGEFLTPNQIHYGVGEEKMLDCFDYTPRTREEVYNHCFIQPTAHDGITEIVGYKDTPCFMLEKCTCNEYVLNRDYFVSIVCTKDGGSMIYNEKEIPLSKGDKYFISAKCNDLTLKNTEVLICCPPQI